MSKDGSTKTLVPKERVISRGRGCWSCIHYDTERSNASWTEKRQRDLTAAVELSLKSEKGENDVRVVNIRRMVDSLDHLIASKGAGICTGGGLTEDEKGRERSVGDFVMAAFLCRKWSGRQGSSLAHEGKPDLLPGELRDKLDGN